MIRLLIAGKNKTVFRLAIIAKLYTLCGRMRYMPNVGFQPSPGFVLISPIEEAQGLSVRKDLRKGTVVAVGNTLLTDFNASISCPCSVGDVIQRAARYEGDVFLDKRYEIVRFQDVQGVYE